ncbi:hypothetical protein K7432_000445 [Basidiobolus ranarum]|uniref:Uncharacterized protein n=1 Tax=Basidiobolus ranarum TaxID=34480 RepID=A0ABR2X4M0_9FUNG
MKSSTMLNTPKSIMYCWAALAVAAGGGYYLAKREIDNSRRERAITARLERYAALDSQNK